MPQHITADGDTSAPELPVTVDMPGTVADFLRAAELEPAEPGRARSRGDRTARPVATPCA
ncbi:hypothetical protein ACWD3J_46010 [Streptomyces sp. NPDC002755]